MRESWYFTLTAKWDPVTDPEIDAKTEPTPTPTPTPTPKPDPKAALFSVTPSAYVEKIERQQNQ